MPEWQYVPITTYTSTIPILITLYRNIFVLLYTTFTAAFNISEQQYYIKEISKTATIVILREQ